MRRTGWTAGHDHDRAGPGRALRAAGRACHRHGCRPPGDRRVHPRPARAGRLRAGGPGAVGRDRFGCRRLPRGRGDRRRPAARGAAAVPDVVAGLARGRGVGRDGAGLRERGRRHHGHGRRLLRRRDDARGGRTRRTERQPIAARQLRGPDADGRPVRPLGHVGRAGRRDRQQDRVADRLHDAVRRLGLRVQPDRRSVQEPGPPGRGRARGARMRSSARRRRPTCGPARQTRPRVASATRSSTGSCSGGSTSDARSRRWSLSGSMQRWSSGSTGWSPAPSSSARCRRSPSSGHGPPASTTSIRVAGRGRRAGDRRAGRRRGRDPVRRGHPDREPRRHHAPGARGPCRASR